MAIRGHVDIAQDGQILGWAWDDAAPAQQLEILAQANGKTICSCRASVFRQDLVNENIGNGRHAFCLPIPDLTQRQNLIRIIEAQSGQEIDGSPIDRRSVTEDNPLHLVFDVTDLLMFLDTHAKPTGIPRVQIEILRVIFANCLYKLDKIHFVAISCATHLFEEVDKNSLLEFVNRLKFETVANDIHPDGLIHIDRLLSFKPFNPDSSFCKNSVLIATGSCWGIPEFFVLANQLRHRGMKFIPLIHDIIPVIEPSLAPPEMEDIFNSFLRKVFRCADVIMAVSKHCANDVTQFASACGYQIKSIKVVKNGGDTPFFEEKTVSSHPYALVVGTIEARKNHIILVRAWERLLAKYGEDLPDLVFVGSLGWNIKELLDLLKASHFLNGHVRILTGVADNELAGLYQNCIFTACASLYEGWGLPVAESLSFGKTCLCSSAASLPEVGLDFCLYFNPRKLDDVTAKAEKLLFDAATRESLETHIFRDYQPITWETMATSIIATALEVSAKPSVSLSPLPAGMECAFWQPVPLLKSTHLRDIMSFSRGYLSDKKLDWDNYIIGDELFASGALQPRDSDGLLGDPGGNTLRFRVSSDNALINLLLEVPDGAFPQEIEFYHKRQFVESAVFYTRRQVARLQAEDFRDGDTVSIFIKHRHNKSVRYQSLLVLDKGDIEGRLTLQERIQAGECLRTRQQRKEDNNVA